MGHQRSKIHITFEDLPDLEIWARSISVRKALSLMRLAGAMDGVPYGQLKEADVEELFTAFVGRVSAWTLEDDDGSPLPVSLDSLLEWDFGEAMRMVVAWVQQATSVALPQAASPAASPAEASIPMTPAMPDSATGM